MLNFDCGVEGVPTIDLTKDEVKVCNLPHKGNIAEAPEDDMEMPTAVPSPSTCLPTTQAGSSKTPAPPADQQLFSLQLIGRLDALMLKENRTLTLMKVGTKEALTHFDAHASQDETRYDGGVSNAEEDDIKVVPDEVDDTLIESLKPGGAISTADKEVQKATNKSGGGQTSKSADKNLTCQPSNKASSGTRHSPVCYDQSILTEGCRDKYLKDYISVHCVQLAGHVLFMSCIDMLPEKQKMSTSSSIQT